MSLQKNYRQHIDQVKYSPVIDTPEIILAKKNAQLVSNVSQCFSNAAQIADVCKKCYILNVVLTSD